VSLKPSAAIRPRNIVQGGHRSRAIHYHRQQQEIIHMHGQQVGGQRPVIDVQGSLLSIPQEVVFIEDE
jgi:hypothetical protein